MKPLKVISLFVIILSVLLVVVAGKKYQQRRYSLELIDAVQQRNIEQVKELLNNPLVDVNYRYKRFIDYSDYMGTGLVAYSAIGYAVANNPPHYEEDYDLFVLLLEHGAEVKSGFVMRVLLGNSPQFLTYLLENSNVEIPKNRELFEIARHNTHHYGNQREILFQHGLTFEDDVRLSRSDTTDEAIQEKVNHYTDKLVAQAVQYESVEALNVLLKNGAKIPDNDNVITWVYNNPDMVEYLIKKQNIDPNLHSQWGRPLFFSAGDTAA